MTFKVKKMVALLFIIVGIHVLLDPTMPLVNKALASFGMILNAVILYNVYKQNKKQLPLFTH